MIDLSYKQKKDKKKDELYEFPPIVQGLILVFFGAYFAFILLSAICGEPIF